MNLRQARDAGYVELARWIGPRGSMILVARDGKTLLMMRRYPSKQYRVSAIPLVARRANGMPIYNSHPSVGDVEAFAERGGYERTEV